MTHDSAIILWSETTQDMNLRGRFTMFGMEAYAHGVDYELPCYSSERNVKEWEKAASFLRLWADYIENTVKEEA